MLMVVVILTGIIAVAAAGALFIGWWVSREQSPASEETVSVSSMLIQNSYHRQLRRSLSIWLTSKPRRLTNQKLKASSTRAPA
jgi:hypothetical protein